MWSIVCKQCARLSIRCLRENRNTGGKVPLIILIIPWHDTRQVLHHSFVLWHLRLVMKALLGQEKVELVMGAFLGFFPAQIHFYSDSEPVRLRSGKITPYLPFWSVKISSPDCFVRLHEHSPVSAGNWHGVVAYADLVPPQQDLSSDLQSLVERSQQKHSDTGTYHLWDEDRSSEFKHLRGYCLKTPIRYSVLL